MRTHTAFDVVGPDLERVPNPGLGELPPHPPGVQPPKDLLKTVVKAILGNPHAFQPWSVQGFGFARLHMTATTRLHVWCSALRTPGLTESHSDIHDHLQWGLTSTVVAGVMCNERFIQDVLHGVEHMAAIVTCGVGAKASMAAETAKTKRRFLTALPSEFYHEGQSYHQEPGEIHRSIPEDGTVTLMRKFNMETNDATVFWQEKLGWVDAEPRPATVEEIDLACKTALERWFI